MIYNVIRDIEYTFRILKTYLGLPAYWLVSTLRYQLKQIGYNSQ